MPRHISLTKWVQISVFHPENGAVWCEGGGCNGGGGVPHIGESGAKIAQAMRTS